MTIEEKKERKIAELVREIGRSARELGDSWNSLKDVFEESNNHKYDDRVDDVMQIVIRCIGIDQAFFNYGLNKKEVNDVYKNLDKVIHGEHSTIENENLLYDLKENIELLLFMI